MIIIDDASDNECTLALLEKYRLRDNRVSVIHLKENSGAGACRNLGLQLACGDFLLFLDSDDFFEPNLLSSMYEVITKTESDLVICGSEGFDVRYKRKVSLEGSSLSYGIIGDGEVVSPKQINEKVFQLTTGWAWDKMYKTSFIRSNGLEFQAIPSSNDGFFTYISFIKAERIATISKSLIVHNTGIDTSIEATRESSMMCAFKMFFSVYDELKKIGSYDLYKRSFLNRFSEYMVWSISCDFSYKQWKKMYTYLKEVAITKLGLDNISESYLYRKQTYFNLRRVITCSAEEYIYEEKRKLASDCLEKTILISKLYNLKKWNVTFKQMKNGYIYCRK